MALKRVFFLGLALVCLLGFLIFNWEYCQASTEGQNVPAAQDGILDISNWDFAKQGMVKLTGDWSFFWQQLLYPEQISVQPEYTINVPRSWNGQIYGNQTLPGQGYGTYRLIIRLDNSEIKTLGLFIPYMSTSYRLWVNGELLAENGRVGSTPDKVIPQYRSEVVFFDISGPETELVVQTANFHHRRGGMWQPIQLGTVEQAYNTRQHQMGVLIIVGSLLVMGLYHLILFMVRRRDTASMYFGLICLLVSLRLMLLGCIPLTQIFPNFDWEFSMKLEYLTLILGIWLFMVFLSRLYPRQIPSLLIKTTMLISGLYVLLVLITPALFYSRILVLYQIFCIILGPYLLYIFIKGSSGRRREQWLILVGVIMLFAAVLNDIFYYMEIVHYGPGIGVGVLFFVFAQSAVLSIRNAEAFSREESLAQENHDMLERIRDMNRALEEKVQERTYELNAMVEQLNHEILERQEIAEKLKMHATTDALTGLFNRATGMALLVNQLNLSERNKWNLTICFADLDYLKQVNDKYGHQAGDEMIKAASQIIVDNIRESDSIFRMGGDEFIIIFPQCSVAEAAHIWSRIQGSIDIYNQSSTRDWSISISCGFAQYTPGSRRKVADLIKEADQEMYRYKTLYRKLDL